MRLRLFTPFDGVPFDIAEMAKMTGRKKKVSLSNEPLSNWKMNACDEQLWIPHMWELGISMLKHHRIRTQMHAFQHTKQTLDVPISIEIQLILVKWVSSQTDRFLSLCRAYQKPILRWLFTTAKLFRLLTHFILCSRIYDHSIQLFQTKNRPFFHTHQRTWFWRQCLTSWPLYRLFSRSLFLAHNLILTHSFCGQMNDLQTFWWSTQVQNWMRLKRNWINAVRSCPHFR